MTEPKIRFLNEDGNFFPKWETTFIGEIVERQEHPVKVDKEVEYREIGIRSHGKGIFHKDPVTGKELGNKRVFDIVPDCLVLNIVFAWERAVAKTTTDEVGMIASHRFPMYKPKDGILDLDYIVRYLISDKGKKILELASPGGAGRNRTLGQKAFMESELPLPCYEEQKKIAEFFDKIDDVISNVEKELEAYKRLKAGMLQKMFPRNGSRVPEVRFPGFTEDWEQRKLSELATMHARIGWQNLRTSEFLDDGDYMLITGTDFEDGRINFSTCHYVEKERYDQDKHIQISDGSILITKDGTLGKVAYVQGLQKPATLNAGVFNVEIKDEKKVDGKYLFQYLEAPFLMDYVSQKATGGTIKHLNQNILVDFPVMMPEKAEQEKIGRYFESIDNLITLQQHELEEWNMIKTGYISKMFI